MRTFDEVSPGFSSRFDNAADATQTLLDIGQAHKVALAAAQKEAARQAVVENVARKARLGQDTAADREIVAGMIADRKAGDRADGQADRAGVASSIADRRAAVAAVRCGQVVLGRALIDYELSLEEFAAWHGAFRLGPAPSASMVERRVLLLDSWEWLKLD